MNFRRGFRLLTFRNVSADHQIVTPFVLLLLGVILLAVKAIGDYVEAAIDQTFSEWGVVAFLACWMLSSIVIAWCTQKARAASFSRTIADLIVITIFVGASRVAILICWYAMAQKLFTSGIPVQGLWYAAQIVVAMLAIIGCNRAGRMMWPNKPRYGGSSFIAAAILPAMIIPNTTIFEGANTNWARSDVWRWARYALYERNYKPEDEAPIVPVDYEGLIYQQPAKVQIAIDKLAKPANEKPEFYFLGMAPSAVQTVFASEVRGAKTIFENRMSSKGHSILLINSDDNSADTPLASITNLELALVGLAKVMRQDKDILTLFITSHGSSGLISVSMPGVPFNQITSKSLRAALNKSGIKNQIIIISACYSGSLVPELANDNTLIMTASSASKTSFGCSNQRDWTYFGDALFNHALSKTRSFPDAFKIAKDTVNTWETEQKLDHSDPQISLGKNIATLLESVTSNANKEAAFNQLGR